MMTPPRTPAGDSPYWLGTIQLNRHNLDDLAWRLRMAGDVSEAIDNVHAWLQSHVTGDDRNQLGIAESTGNQNETVRRIVKGLSWAHIYREIHGHEAKRRETVPCSGPADEAADMAAR